LQRLSERFGDWSLAFAAYNWGPGNVEETPDPADWPQSVRAYVEHVLTHWSRFEGEPKALLKVAIASFWQRVIHPIPLP
jgi:hypothetical protein